MEDNEARFLRRSDLDDDGDIFVCSIASYCIGTTAPLEILSPSLLPCTKQSLSCFLLEILQQSPVLCLSSGELES